MKANDCIQLLEAAGIRPTSTRLLVCEAIGEIHHAFSLKELTERLETVDKSGIFRALTLFRERGLVQPVDDGSGSLKYCLHHDLKKGPREEAHAHFYCEKCRQTLCLNNVELPAVPLPEGFSAEQYNFVIKGVCDKCNGK